MKIEESNPAPIKRIVMSLGGGITSPSDDPPNAPVFVVNTYTRPGGPGHRFIFTEDETARLHTEMGTWLADLKRRREIAS